MSFFTRHRQWGLVFLLAWAVCLIVSWPKFSFDPESGKRFHLLTGDEPPMYVDDVASAEDQQRLFERIQNEWRQLGETEPFWSVATSESYKQASIEEAKKDFYHSGTWDITRFLAALDRNGIVHSASQSCLEYGCGVGRATSPPRSG